MVLSGHMPYAYSEGSEAAVASIHPAAEKSYSRKLISGTCSLLTTSSFAVTVEIGNRNSAPSGNGPTPGG